MLNPHGIPIIWGLNHVTNPYFPGFTTLIISFLIVPITYYYIVIGYYYHCHYSSSYHYYHELLILHIITITITINIIIIMTISIIYYQWLSSSQPPPALLELCRALISGDEDDLQILALFLHDVVKPGLQVVTLWILTGEIGMNKKWE